MMYSFSGPPQVRRKSIPDARVTSAKDMLGGADWPRLDDDAARFGWWDGEVRCGGDSPDSQATLAAASARTSADLGSRTPIIGWDRQPSRRSQAASYLV